MPGSPHTGRRPSGRAVRSTAPRLAASPAILPGAEPKFRAGAAAADVTPEKFPVVVNCGDRERVGGRPGTPVRLGMPLAEALAIAVWLLW